MYLWTHNFPTKFDYVLPKISLTILSMFVICRIVYVLKKARKKHGKISKPTEPKKKTTKETSDLFSEENQNTNNEQEFLVLRKRNVEISSDVEEVYIYFPD